MANETILACKTALDPSRKSVLAIPTRACSTNRRNRLSVGEIPIMDRQLLQPINRLTGTSNSHAETSTRAPYGLSTAQRVRENSIAGATINMGKQLLQTILLRATRWCFRALTQTFTARVASYAPADWAFAGASDRSRPAWRSQR